MEHQENNGGRVDENNRSHSPSHAPKHWNQGGLCSPILLLQGDTIPNPHAQHGGTRYPGPNTENRQGQRRDRCLCRTTRLGEVRSAPQRKEISHIYYSHRIPKNKEKRTREAVSFVFVLPLINNIYSARYLPYRCCSDRFIPERQGDEADRRRDRLKRIGYIGSQGNLQVVFPLLHPVPSPISRQSWCSYPYSSWYYFRR
jgi:hypothetical protein